MSGLEAFLDETPGETRGVIRRNGRAEHLLIDRESDAQGHRLGSRSVGRVTQVMPALGGAFVDIGTGLAGFLSYRKHEVPDVGEKIEVEVTAEPRSGKGAALREIGPGEGAPRLIAAGPSVREELARLAPGVAVVEGLEAIRAGLDAEEEALSPGVVLRDVGLDLMVERTRAMVTADFDWAPAAGLATGAKARDRANRQGLVETARLLGLKRWGGLVVIDLIGAGHDGEAVTQAAKAAFRQTGVVFGPVSRFGVLQLSTPWTRTPVEELLRDPAGRRPLAVRAIDVVRAVRQAMLTDTATPRVVARCAPDEAEAAGPWIARLGPRAAVRADATRGPGAYILDKE